MQVSAGVEISPVECRRHGEQKVLIFTAESAKVGLVAAAGTLCFLSGDKVNHGIERDNGFDVELDGVELGDCQSQVGAC